MDVDEDEEEEEDSEPQPRRGGKKGGGGGKRKSGSGLVIKLTPLRRSGRDRKEVSVMYVCGACILQEIGPRK